MSEKIEPKELSAERLAEIRNDVCKDDCPACEGDKELLAHIAHLERAAESLRAENKNLREAFKKLEPKP